MTKRFYSKIKINPTSGCHEWTGALSDKGYGRFAVKRKNRHAHRIAWELANGPIPPDKWVLHRCDNPRCVNPAHLYLGTVLENTRDMIAADNQYRGACCGFLRLAPASALRSVQLAYCGLAHIWPGFMGVTVETIKAVQYRRNWRHI